MKSFTQMCRLMQTVQLANTRYHGVEQSQVKSQVIIHCLKQSFDLKNIQLNISWHKLRSIYNVKLFVV